MRPIFVLVFVALLIGCDKAPETVAVAHQTEAIPGLSQYALAEPITKDNLTLVPVVLTSQEKSRPENYISLAEAKRDGLVEIREMPEGQEVNRLWVTNLGKKPLLLLGGELLLGGKQDRIVAKDTVVPPQQEMPVSVFCVEHGRWTGGTDKFQFSESMVPQGVREKAAMGDQSEVWDSVSEYNKKAGPTSDATTINSGISQVRKRTEDGLQTILKQLENEKNVVGVVCLLNGEIVSFDLFGDEALFASNRSSLLRGLLTEAAVRPEGGKASPDMSVVADFVKHSLSGQRQQTELTRSAATWRISGGVAGVESTEPEDRASFAGPMAKQKLIHGSYTPAGHSEE
jgi:hypothetical protein